MANERVKQGRRGALGRLSEGGAAALLFVLAVVAGVAILAVPRPVAPVETPGLHLAPRDVAAVNGRDARLARDAPRFAEADALRRMYREHGRAEIHGETQSSARRRAGGLAAATRSFREARGDGALWALRAEAVRALPAALAAEDGEERQALLGTFERVLGRYGGTEAAPDFVVRTLFVARWNAAHGLPLTEGMEPAELRAYWGWLALEVEDAPLDRRLAALEGYEAAGGERAEEARGALLYRAGRPIAAAEAFERAYGEEGTLRLRNLALAALSTASAEW